jgi:hypothetical protein
MSTYNELLIGGDGTILITAADGDTTDLSLAYMVINGAATFTALEDSAGNDMTAAISEDGGCGIDTELSVGITIRGIGGKRISRVHLSAGSVIGVIENG